MNTSNFCVVLFASSVVTTQAVKVQDSFDVPVMADSEFYDKSSDFYDKSSIPVDLFQEYVLHTIVILHSTRCSTLGLGFPKGFMGYYV